MRATTCCTGTRCRRATSHHPSDCTLRSLPPNVAGIIYMCSMAIVLIRRCWPFTGIKSRTHTLYATRSRNLAMNLTHCRQICEVNTFFSLSVVRFICFFGVFVCVCVSHSGLMYSQNLSVRRVPEVLAHSGSVLLHFFSDDAYNMSGFNISYKINGCPTTDSSVNCSGHGYCTDDGTCICDSDYEGFACQLAKCPGQCGLEYGHGRCDNGEK